MAVAGGATVAYKCKLVDGRLQRNPTTAMDTLYPLPATSAILRGETVIVAGADVMVTARLVELELKVINLQLQIDAERSIRNGLDEL